MFAFDVRDMYSSRSAGAIVKSVKALDSAAHVRVDLASHSVEVDTDHAQLRDLSDAIGRAGFTAVPVVQSAALEPASPEIAGPPPPPKIAFDGSVDLMLTWD